ncbi:MAG: ABC transporter permease [Leucobacter sp.]
MPKQLSENPKSETRVALPHTSLWHRLLTGTVGTLSEAWTELRTHKLRVILSLIGIAVAVAALTAVVALGELQKQSSLEQQERYGGRIATLRIDTFSQSGAPIDWHQADKNFTHVNERYGFDYTTRLIDGVVQVPIQLPEGVTSVMSRQFDPAYPIIHRLSVQEGRWFNSTDRELLAPPVVISGALWEALGSPPLDTHPVLEMSGPYAGNSPVIGVTPKDGDWDEALRVDMLYDSYFSWVGAVPSDVSVSREVWAEAGVISEIGPALAMDLRSSLPSGIEISVSRTDAGASADFEQSFLMMQLITGGIAGIVLLLGGLSLVNIQLVAMRQRIREIGIRRSFGASGARIFVAVMMESVVATTVAGILGIVFAVAVLKSPLLMENLFFGLQDVPPFPLSAAIIGLIAAVLTGAIAGLVPALVATRVRVIEAMRF